MIQPMPILILVQKVKVPVSKDDNVRWRRLLQWAVNEITMVFSSPEGLTPAVRGHHKNN